MNDTAIVIVTYNSAHVIGACLKAALASGAECVVVDNASLDGTVEVARRHAVRVIANEINTGFAAAVNQGIRELEAEYVLLLNPDAVLSDSFQPLRACCRDPHTGAAAGLLTGEDGVPQAGFTVRRLPTPLALGFEVLGLNRTFPRNPVNWRFRCFDVDLSAAGPIPVEQPAGAFLMFRRRVWEEMGGFDERFHPLWFEDVDFCRRLRNAGKPIFLLPEVRARHAGSHSIVNMAREIRRLYWYGNLLRYAAKHFSPPGRKLVCACVILRARLQYAGDVLTRYETGKMDVWAEVARLAFRCFMGRSGWDRPVAQSGAHGE